MHTYTQMKTHTCIYIHMDACVHSIHVYMHMAVCMAINVQACASMNICVQVLKHVCACTYIDVFIHVCIYTLYVCMHTCTCI